MPLESGERKRSICTRAVTAEMGIAMEWDSLFGRLEERYLKLARGPEYWAKESPILSKILPMVGEAIAGRYEVGDPIGLGGAGVVLKVKDTNLGTIQALKCARPVQGREPVLAKIVAGEISRLREASHPNIISIYYHGQVEHGGITWPFFVMEYLDGAEDAWDYLTLRTPSEAAVLGILRQCIDGLAYLHSRGTLHGDVKFENLLVAPDGRTRISDLGSARRLADDPGGTTLTFTKPWAHPDLLTAQSSSSPSDENRAMAGIARAQLRPEFDLYPLGRNIIRLLRYYHENEIKTLGPYTKSYLELMGCRLLDGHNQEDQRALGLPRGVFGKIKYALATQAADDMRKLTGEYALHTAVCELDHHYPRTVQISSPGPQPFTDRVAVLLNQPMLRRLGSVSQLGMIVQVYPTANHSRLEHVLGTLANVARYCDALWNDPINPLFRQLTTEADIRALLAAALCHDVGQYPLAHDLEEAEPAVFSHKTLTLDILNGVVANQEADSLRAALLSEPWSVDPSSVASILGADPYDTSVHVKTRLLHSIVDGPVDADKLDYLIRDSRHLGVPYGQSIDVERLLQCLTVVFRPKNGDAYMALGIHEKGKVPAESVAFARYAMFGAVYWHHTSRSAKSMLHRAVWDALPPSGKRGKGYQEFRRGFVSAVMSMLPKEGMQLALSLPEERDRLPQSHQLNVGDYALLDWLYGRTSAAGQALLQMLCERRLFKRLLVISEQKNTKLWQLLGSVARQDADQRLVFQKKLQEGLVRAVEKLDERERTTSVLAEDVTDDIVTRHSRGDVLFIVDIPTERRGSAADLYYLPEARGRGDQTLHGESTGLEDSVLWATLAESFLASVGKVRVFCHPDIVDTATAALSRQTIESSLEWAAREVVGR